nr:MAG TPA: hypothetical protein [Caudoviricetes sp.]
MILLNEIKLVCDYPSKKESRKLLRTHGAF